MHASPMWRSAFWTASWWAMCESEISRMPFGPSESPPGQLAARLGHLVAQALRVLGARGSYRHGAGAKRHRDTRPEGILGRSHMVALGEVPALLGTRLAVPTSSSPLCSVSSASSCDSHSTVAGHADRLLAEALDDFGVPVVSGSVVSAPAAVVRELLPRSVFWRSSVSHEELGVTTLTLYQSWRLMC